MGSSQVPTKATTVMLCMGVACLSLSILSYVLPERGQLGTPYSGEMRPKMNFSDENEVLKMNNTPNSKEIDTVRPEWTLYMDFLDEKEVLNELCLDDIRKSVNTTLSRVRLIGNRTHFHLGEEIRVSVTLLDGYGRVRTKGGDQLRVRMYDDVKRAYATGYIIDHRNGTYTAVTRALWTGTTTIAVICTYPRELVRAWYETLNTISMTRIHFAHYNSTLYTGQLVTGYCHPFLDHVSKDPRNVCNRTEQNDGMSLFCYKPHFVRCQDFVRYSIDITRKPYTFSDAEWKLLTRPDRMLPLTPLLNVSIKGNSSLYTQTIRLPGCSDYDASKLWTMPSPVGFFYNNTWRTLHCQTPSQDNIDGCIRNKHLRLIGDSTLRQWFEYMQKAYNCSLLTKLRESYKTCHSEQYGLFVEWSFHSIPGHLPLEENPVRSIPGTIDRFNFTRDHILVIHMQSHVSAYQPRVFRDRMTKIRQAIDRALYKYKNAKIYVKGPGTFFDQQQFNDYFGYVYRAIMLDIFKGVYDKVVYLDTKDMTISTGQVDTHPQERIVKAMLNQLLSYVCH